MPIRAHPGPPTVELVRVSGNEADLIRHRRLLDVVAGVEFPVPAGRFAERGIVIRVIAHYHEAGPAPLLRRAEWNLARPHLTTAQSITNTQP